MRTQRDIAKAFEDVAGAFRHRPELGIGTQSSVTKVVNGLLCEVSEGDWTFSVDMPEAAGGSGTAPTPGVLGRAALGSCLAMSYMMWASKLGIEINALEVQVQADYDEGAIFGTSDAAPGYSEVRYCVKIESAADEAVIIRLLDEADRHSPYLDVFTRPQQLVRRVEVTAPV